MATLNNTEINDTGFLEIPAGTTAQRPASPVKGMYRFNTDRSSNEYYDGSNWVSSQTGFIVPGLSYFKAGTTTTSISQSGAYLGPGISKTVFVVIHLWDASAVGSTAYLSSVTIAGITASIDVIRSSTDKNILLAICSAETSSETGTLTATFNATKTFNNMRFGVAYTLATGLSVNTTTTTGGGSGNPGSNSMSLTASAGDIVLAAGNGVGATHTGDRSAGWQNTEYRIRHFYTSGAGTFYSFAGSDDPKGSLSGINWRISEDTSFEYNSVCVSYSF